MPVTHYDDGALYSGAGVFYGALSPELLAAQILQTRETGLKVTVTDENLNNWTKLTGTEISQLSFTNTDGSKTLRYKFYRARMAAIKLSGGNIIRIRAGDGSDGDRQLYLQTITDPTNAAQWNSWAVQYSGDHVAVALVATGASTYDIYHSKTDGKVYRNNSEVWNPASADADNIGVITIMPVDGGLNGAKIHLQVLKNTVVDSYRVLDIYYTPDLTATAPTPDILNYEWTRHGCWGYVINSTLETLRSIGMFSDPRAHARGDSVVLSSYPDTTVVANRRPTPMRLIRGVGSDWGHNEINNPRMFLLSDGYWYLFYNEHHVDEQYQLISNQYAPVHWQRSKDREHWSEPVNTGIAGLAGFFVFESGSYVYLVGNSEVWRRLNTSTTYDISNYIPELSMEIPRDNQPGNASCLVANPAGINNALLDLSDRHATIEVGIKISTGLFEFVKFNDWWLRNVTREVKGNANRLGMEFEDIWGRLSNKLRDTYNFLGQTLWEDWAAGRRNKAFNYFFVDGGEPVETSDYRLTTSGICLYTGWKGHNPDFTVSLSGVTGLPTVIFRYIDSDNYMSVYLDGTTVKLNERYQGTDTLIDSGSVTPGSTHKFYVSMVFNSYKIYYNDVLVLNDIVESFRVLKPGYVGFSATAYTVSNFTLADFEQNLTMADLIKTALAMGDYHDVTVGNAEAKAYAIIWGPQTDVPTAADGLKLILETEKLELIWRDGFIEVGRFTDNSIVKTIQNRIIDTEHVEETNRRINLAVVDGNEHTWMQVDVPDTQSRDRQIVGYFDLPELLDWDSVKERAAEEIRRGQLGSAPGGTIVLFFDLRRMDVVAWIDNVGNSNNVRIEGMSIQIQQGDKPLQRQTLDTSLVE